MNKDIAKAADRAALQGEMAVANTLARLAGIQNQFGQYPSERLRHLREKQARKHRAWLAACILAVAYALFSYLK